VQALQEIATGGTFEEMGLQQHNRELINKTSRLAGSDFIMGMIL